MATYSKDQLNAIVERVAAEVGKEVEVGEARAFQVSDLRAQFADLVKGGDVAWTISYSTSSVAAVENDKVLGSQGNVAWTISYSTSSAALAQKATGR